jgi:deazaflavin-dependent oxidoreductase (nitroreductase family)
MAETYALTPGRRRVNRILKALLNLGVPMGNTSVLTVSGRRSGKPRSTPVTLLTDGGRRWLVAPYGDVSWVRNARAAGRVQLKRGGRRETVRIVEVDPAQRAKLLKDYLEQNKMVAPFFDAKPGDPLDRFANEAAKHPVFEITSA